MTSTCPLKSSFVVFIFENKTCFVHIRPALIAYVLFTTIFYIFFTVSRIFNIRKNIFFGPE